jgi:hypothetical protein
MSLSPERRQQLREFAAAALGQPVTRIESASADASFRSYWRIVDAKPSCVVMDAPPDKEDVRPWLDIARRLRAAGLNAPDVRAADLEQGFVLMCDLGTRLYLSELSMTTADDLYGDALEALFRAQQGVDCTGLPAYDRNRLTAEMELLPTWFLQRHLGVAPDCAGWDQLEVTFDRLVNNALAQPARFVHRDYHSRNLLVVPGANPGIIDFQDAVRGPLTYDLVSLLRDCYIAWPRDRVLAWAEAYRRRMADAGLTDADAATWKRWFDLMGLQRHLKVLGIFCRLWYRDGKAGYLGDLPLVLRYTLDVADEYAELRDFAHWLRDRVAGRDLTRPA